MDDQPRHEEIINVELSNKNTLEASLEFSTLSHFDTLNGLVILTNKSFGNAKLADSLRCKLNDAPIVILQNGLGVEKPFVDLNFPGIYRCVLFATSQTITENKLRFKPVSVSPIGIIKGESATLSEIVSLISTDHFQFRTEKEIQTIIWKKAIINSVFNSVCPLLETDNGIFHRNEKVLGLAKRIIAECVGIASEIPIGLKAEDVVESLLMISKASDGQLISTYQDIKNKRQTEIETLNFAIVSIAKTLGKEQIVRETKLLGELTKLKSELSLQDS